MSEDNLLIINTEDSVIKEPERLNPLPLYDDNHPMLSKEIPEYPTETLPNHTMDKLVKRMRMTMKQFGGIGLSANQCGVFERVFVIGTDEFQMACINPKVIEVSGETVKESEGCLSYPGMFLKVERPKSILVEFTDEVGQIQKMWLDGVTARCYLHELDHMNGVKFTDKVGPVALSQGRRKQQKMMKKIVRKQKNGV